MAVSVDIKPLAELLDGGFSKSGIRKAFSRFTCERDPDVRLMYLGSTPFGYSSPHGATLCL